MRILRVVRSTSLACGCFAGVYETYEGQTMVIVDEPGSACPTPGHQAGAVVSATLPARLDARKEPAVPPAA